MGKKKTQYDWRYIFYLSAIFLIPVLLFWKAADYDFVWDDKELYINSNNFPEENTFAELADFWNPLTQSNPRSSMYMPVTYTIWSFTVMASRDNGTIEPYTFHIISILIHAMNCMLIFLILHLLLNKSWVAFSGALIFAVHPVQAESVVWISELRGLLSAFFGFAALFLYLKNTDGNNTKGNAEDNKQNIPAIVLFMLSLLSKPTAVVFPLIIFFIELIYYNKPFKEVLSRLKYWFLLILPIAIVSLLTESAEGINTAVPFWTRPLIYLDSAAFYLYKVFLPTELSADYSRTTQHLINSGTLYYTAAVPLVIAALLAFLRKKAMIFSLAFIIFLTGILTVSGLVNFYYQYFSNVADRYIYISMLGVALFYGNIIRRVQLERIGLLLTAVLAVSLITLSYNRIDVWSNNFSLWNDAIEKNPSSSAPAYSGRGIEYINQGKYMEAVSDFNTAISLDSAQATYYYNRANAYLDLKEYQKAIADYKSTIALNDIFTSAYNNLGLAYSEQDKPDSAIIYYTGALKINPDQFDTYINRGIAYAQLQMFDYAVRDFSAALKLNPGSSSAIQYLNMAKQELQNKITDTVDANP